MALTHYPWGHQRRYNSYTEYFRRTFGQRVQKVTLDAGFSCPNRDGTRGTGGCTYCNNDAFNPSYCQPQKCITQQIEEGITFHRVRYRRANQYLAYFQAYSNTHAPVERLKALFNEALAFPEVVGLVIGTRPDCIDREKLEYLSQLAKTNYVIIEYGVESCYNATLERINRQHTFEESEETIRLTSAYGIKTGIHLIFGLPGETREQMLAEAEIISRLPIDTVKFHQLQIIRDTAMALEYGEHPERFDLFSLPEYLDFIIRFMEHLNPAIVIERFTGEAPPRFQAAPTWDLRTDQVAVMIEKKLEECDTWQGRYYN